MKPKVHARNTSILLLVLPIALAPSSFAQDQPVMMQDNRGLSHRVELHPQTGSARWIYDPAINVADLGLGARALSESIHPLLLEKLLAVFLGSTNTSGSWLTSYLASGSYTIHLPLQNEWVELHDANDNALEQVATVKWTPKSRPRASNNKTDFRPTHSVPPPGIGSPVIGVDVRDCRR